MEIHLITGRPGSGKSRLCYQRAARRLLAGGEALILVPEQITLQGEQMLMEALGTPGFLGKPLMSPTGLAREVFARQNTHQPELMDPRGRAMAIQRVAGSLNLPVLGRAVKNPAFAADMAELLEELKRFDVEIPMLLEAGARQSPLLASKTADVAAIAQAMDAFMAEQDLSDPAMRFEALIQSLPRADWLRSTEVYIDGFDQYPAQWIRLILALANTAASVTVSFRLCDPTDSDAALYYKGFEEISVLTQAAEEAGLSVTREHLNPRLEGSLARLSRALYAYPLEKLPDEGRIHVLACSDPESQLEAVAARIQALARQGCHYRDMAVLTPDMTGQGPDIRRVFDRFGIATFYDSRMPLNQHPLVGVILAALAVAERGGRTADWIALAKSTLLELPSPCVEQFEIYLNAYNIRGMRRMAAELTHPCGELDLEAVNQVRQKLAEGVTALPRSANAGQWADALLELMRRWELEEAVERHGELCRSRGRDEAAQQGQQALEQVKSLLDELAWILPREELSVAELTRLLEAGFAATEVGILPTAADAVLLGDMGGRTKPARTGHIFIVGAVEGALPAPGGESSIFHDGDLDAFADAGLYFGHSSLSTAAQSKLAVAEVAAKARESLTFAYPLSREDGQPCQPAPLVRRTLDMLDLEPETPARWDAKTPATLALPVARALGLYRQGRAADPHFRQMLNTLRAHPEGAKWVEKMAPRTDSGQVGDIPQRRISVTRMEEYAACPMAWFVRYQLQPKEWPRMLTEMNITGTLAHEVLRRVADLRDIWKSEEQSAAATHEIFGQLRREQYGDTLDDLPLAQYVLDQLEESCALAARAMSRQLQAGHFEPVSSEVPLQREARVLLPDGSTLPLEGRMDRVDRCGDLIRLVDYKTGKTELKPEQVLTGEQLQLFLYMDTLLADGSQPAGLYYAPVRQDFTREEGEDPQKPQGLTCAQTESLLAENAALTRQEAEQLSRNANDPPKGGLISPQGFATMCRLARESAGRLAQGMKKGRIPAYRDGERCKSCAYAHLCRSMPGEKKPKASVKALQAAFRQESMDGMDP